MKIYFMLCLSFCALLNAAHAQIDADDLRALKQFYDANCGEGCILDWDFTAPVESLEGVTLENTRVTTLLIQGKGLSGELTDLNLPFLVDLNLQNNQLSGTIPDFSNLGNLIILRLDVNRFTGEIPDFSSIQQATLISLMQNKLSGQTPDFSNLPELATLYLHDNLLTGSIPNYANLPNLVGIYMSNNQLTAPIPNFTKLTNLRYFDVQNNQLSGQLPAFSNSPLLEYLNVYQNKLSGEIPEYPILESFDFDNINRFDIRENNFSNEDFFGETGWYGIYAFFDPEVYFYSPQLHGNEQLYKAAEGDSRTLELSSPLADIANVNKTYQWFKDDIAIDGATDLILPINNISREDCGVYQLRILHSVGGDGFPDLDIISRNIFLRVDHFDLACEPIYDDQLIVEFESEEQYKTYLANNPGVFALDSCNCEKELYLLQLPDDAKVDTVTIDTEKPIAQMDGETLEDGLTIGVNRPISIIRNRGLGTSYSYKSNRAIPTEKYPDLVNVYIIDTGLDTIDWNYKKYLYNPAEIYDCFDLNSEGYNLLDRGITSDYPETMGSGHGTFGTRAILGGTEEYADIKLVPLKSFDSDGYGDLFKLICSIYFAVDFKADIINISAGFRGQNSKNLEKAIKYAQEKGVFVVAAAGNDNKNMDDITVKAKIYPAYLAKKYDNVISVASIKNNNMLSSASNYGQASITAAAYGNNIVGYGLGNIPTHKSGTSVAAFLFTRELAIEIAADKKNRGYKQVWDDFKVNMLVDNPATSGKTKLSKRLNISLERNERCTTPSDININIFESGEVNIEWGEEITGMGYKAQIRKKGETDWINTTLSESKIVFENLTPCTRYEFRVSSICPNREESFHHLETFITTGCNVCQDEIQLPATKVSGNSFELYWPEYNGNLFEYSLNGSDNWQSIILNDTTTQILNLDSCQTYIWRLSAQCDESGWNFYYKNYSFKTKCSSKLFSNNLLLTATPSVSQNEVVGACDAITCSITIFNVGNEPAKNIEITGYLEESYDLYFYDDNGWSSSKNNQATNTISNLDPGAFITLNIDLYPNGTLIQNETVTFNFEITKANESNGNLINLNADFESVKFNILDDFFDLALVTYLPPEQNESAKVGEDFTVRVCLYNLGSLTAVNTEISFYLPNGIYISPNDKNDLILSENGITVKKINELLYPCGGSTIDVLLNTESDISGGVYNIAAEISASQDLDGNFGIDIDSNYDQNPANDAGGSPKSRNDNYIYGDGTGAVGDTIIETDEDDHDPVCVTIISENISYKRKVGKFIDIKMPKLEVFPTPVVDFINISMYAESDSQVQLQIIDVVGNIKYDKKIQTVEKQLAVQVDMKNFSSGVYMINTIINDTLLSKKIVKY